MTDDQPNHQKCNYDFKVGKTTPIGSYPDGASPYGCHDMAGNVWEWTSTESVRGGAVSTMGQTTCARLSGSGTNLTSGTTTSVSVASGNSFP